MSHESTAAVLEVPAEYGELDVAVPSYTPDAISEAGVSDINSAAVVINGVKSANGYHETLPPDSTAEQPTASPETPPPPQNQDSDSSSSSFNRRSRLAKDRSGPDIDRLYLNDIGRHKLLKKADEQRLGKMIQDSQKAEARLNEDDLIYSPQRIQQLLETVESGDQASEIMINSNLRLVVSIAKKYLSTGASLLDLVQDGNLGLMRAVEKFDYQKGFKFSTYASWWIRQAISRGIDNTGRTIRLPVHAHDNVRKLQKHAQVLFEELKRTPTREELMKDLQWDEAQLEEVQADAILQPFSTNEMIGHDGMEFGDLYSDPASDRAFASLEDFDLRNKRIVALKGLLNPIELFAVAVYGRLVDGEQRTLEEVNELLHEHYPRYTSNVDKLRKIIAEAAIKMQHPAAYQEVKQAMLPDTADDQSWKEDASCKDAQVDQFVYATKRELVPPVGNPDKKAKKVHPLVVLYCGNCVVSDACREQGAAAHAWRGVWGGKVLVQQRTRNPKS